MVGVDLIIMLIISSILLFLLLIKSKQLKKANADLTKSQKILDSINIPIFYKDKNGKFIACNKAFTTSFSSFKKQAIEQLNPYKATATQEIELTYDNNIKKQTLMYFTNFLDGSVAALIDIAAFKKEKKTLLQKYENLNLALKGSDSGYWEWDVKSNDIILSNDAKKILGFSEDENPPKNMADWMNLVESYDIAKTNEALASHIAGKSPSINVDHRLKTSLNETWINLRGKGVYGENNAIHKVYGTVRDISNRKIELTKLTQQKNLYMTFMDNLPALSFIKDKNGRYIYLNNYYQKLLGFKTWENKTAYDLFEKEIADSVKQSDREALYEGISKHEEVIPNEEGEKQLFETYKFAISSEKEKVLCGFGLDISKEKIYQDKIELFAKVFENTNEVIIITDEKGLILSVNKAFTLLTGFSENEVIGKNPRIRKSGKHSKEFYKVLWEELLSQGSWSGEIFNKNKDGSIVPELMNINAIRDKKDRITNFVGISQNIQKQKSLEANLKKMAHFDILTGLANRSLFEDRLQHSLSKASRYETLMSLIFIDLDDFKSVNDTKGHNSGDLVLKEVAKRLRHIIRESDTVARLGGDEFVIILEKISRIEDISIIAQKIISQLSTPINIEKNQKCSIGASVGISIYPNHSKNQKDLLKYADMAMYEAKKAGKNCYKIYTKK